MDRRSTGIPAERGVYRTPGREATDAPIPPPSRRALLSPLGRGLACVALLVVPPLVFNAWLVDLVLGVPHESRFIPALDAIQDLIALLLLATLALVVHRVVKRVRPTWAALRLPAKIAYVAALLVLQSGVVIGAELALFESRGGLKLFEPTYRATSVGPAARTAYLYGGGFGCSYDVYVAPPLSPTMKQSLHMTRATCLEPTPTVKWKDDGSVYLVDKDGKTLEPQASPPFTLFGGGC